MLIRKIILMALIAISLYSAETNARIVLGHKCTLGLLPIGINMGEDLKKEEIVQAYEKKGFNVSILSSPTEIKDTEFISDASVDCSSTFVGIMATTSVRVLETNRNKIVGIATSPTSIDSSTCKIDLFSAIKSLPDCQIK